MKNLLLMLICSIALGSCALNNTLHRTIANSSVPSIADAQFDCGVSPVLPSDAELAKWSPAQIYAWGENSWKWGNKCANLLQYNKHYILCQKGNKLECTFANEMKK